MTRDSDTEIPVIGAGPVGLAAALELARRGCAPQLFDKAAGPSSESRALGIHARTLEILEPGGVTDRLLARGYRVNGAILRSGSREVARLSLKVLPHRFNFILSLPQSQTEEVLIEALKERGIEVAWHSELRDVRLDGKAGCCRIGTPAGDLELRPAMMIGADGAHSSMRKALGIGFPGESDPQSFGLADVTLSQWPYPPDHAVITFEDRHLVGFIPMGKGYGRFVGNHPRILERLPREAKVAQVEWESEFRISYRQAETYQRENCFLAGDAAHVHSPVGARGMNLGIEDAATLAWLIEKGETARYTGLRHPIGARVLKQTGQQTRQIMGAGWAARQLRDLLMPLALKAPALQRFAATRLTGLDMPPPPWLERDAP